MSRRATRYARGDLARAGVLGAALLATGAAGAQLRHRRRIAADPQAQRLRSLPGRPLTIRSPDGTVLYAEVFGPDGGQTFVLAHGWTENLTYWTPVIAELTRRGFKVLAYDLRGHGRSEAAAGGDYAIARFGEDLEAVLRAGLTDDGERAVLVGHSLGAMSIVAWAESHEVPQRACGAALINTGVGQLLAEALLVPVPALAKIASRLMGVRLMGWRAGVPRFSTPVSHAIIRHAAFGPAATPAQVAFYERMLVACPPDARADTGIAVSELELSHAVPRLSVPTLVLAGEKDRLTPPVHARRIAEALPQLSSLIVLEETGHMAPLERPEAVSEALLELAGVVWDGRPIAA